MLNACRSDFTLSGCHNTDRHTSHFFQCSPFVHLASVGYVDPTFSCFQVVYGDVYMLDDEMKWKTLTPMPKPDSHIECAWVIVNNSLIIAGGTTEKHPITKRMILVGEVFRFDLDTLV